MLKEPFTYFSSDPLYGHECWFVDDEFCLYRFQMQRNRVRSAGGILNNLSRNDSKLQLQIAATSPIEGDQQYQQQIPIGFSQQLICNPKTLAIQGREM